MTKSKPKVPAVVAAAVLTIHGASQMTPKGRQAVAQWLKQQAVSLLELAVSPGYAERYIARYVYTPKSTKNKKK